MYARMNADQVISSQGAAAMAIMTAACSVVQAVGPPTASELAARGGNFDLGAPIATGAPVSGNTLLLIGALPPRLQVPDAQ